MQLDPSFVQATLERRKGHARNANHGKPSGQISTAPPLHKVTHSQHAKRTSLSPQAVNVSAIDMLFLPELVPRNVQQQTPDADEELLLIQQEAQLKLEVALVWLS